MSDKWILIKVPDTEWQQDKSGFYCIINVVDCIALGSLCKTTGYDNVIVRLDILTSDHSPAVSFQGTAANVRKYAMKYAEEHGWSISLEHAAYIGYELAKAEMLGKDYIQD